MRADWSAAAREDADVRTWPNGSHERGMRPRAQDIAIDHTNVYSRDHERPSRDHPARSEHLVRLHPAFADLDRRALPHDARGRPPRRHLEPRDLREGDRREPR